MILGGGFAGIETSGELMDLLLDARKYYPHISRTDIRVIILEALSFILPGFNEDLASFALKKLQHRGIEVLLNTKLASFSGSEVIIENISEPARNPMNQQKIGSIQTRTLIWTVDLFFDRDISRLKVLRREAPKEYRELDEVDDVW